MKEKQIKNWEKLRSAGRSSFILRKGIIRVGVGIAIFWSIGMQIIRPYKPIWIGPLVALILFPLGGYLWGLYTWKVMERKYQEHIEKNLS